VNNDLWDDPWMWVAVCLATLGVAIMVVAMLLAVVAEIC